MKIIIDNAAYVQKNDLGYLNTSSIAIPASIYIKAFGVGRSIIDDGNRYEFVKFEKESEMDYFKDLDWIIDYNEVKDLSDEELIELGQGIIEEREKIATTFNSMDEEEKNNHQDMVNKCDLLEFKFISLRDILWFKQGHIDMKLPEVDVKMKNKTNKEKA